MLRTAVVLAITCPGRAGSGRSRRHDRAADDPAARPSSGPRASRAGRSASFYVGSIPQGSVYRGSYRTGEGEVLVPAHEGRNHTGLKVDTRFGRLFVAGGALEGHLRLRLAQRRRRRELRAGRRGLRQRRGAHPPRRLLHRLPGAAALPRADPQGRLDRRAEPHPDHRRLPVRARLQRQRHRGAARRAHADRRSRRTSASCSRSTPRPAPAARSRSNTPVTNGDGLLLRGRTLFVVQNRDNKVAVVKLGARAGKRGTVKSATCATASWTCRRRSRRSRSSCTRSTPASTVRTTRTRTSCGCGRTSGGAATWTRSAGRSGSTGSRCARGPWSGAAPPTR